MSDEEQAKPIKYHSLCSECQTGILRLQHLTYFTWLHEELITVPNFPAWVCDVCGRRIYDGRAVLRLNTLLNHEAGLRSSSRRKPGTPRIDQART